MILESRTSTIDDRFQKSVTFLDSDFGTESMLLQPTSSIKKCHQHQISEILQTTRDGFLANNDSYLHFICTFKAKMSQRLFLLVIIYNL